ncbi:MAG: flagellar basal-body MS-ring/collar protein FliF [Legionellales bacterium]
MEKSLNNVIDGLKAIFNFDITRRLFFLAGIAVSVAVGVNLYQWIQDPIYRPLPYSIKDQNLPAIVDALDKANISYKINEDNGTISVPMDDLSAAKTRLSAAGVQKDEGFSYSFLNDQDKLGTSQFIESARYLRALESDLARTIRAIQGISGAKVHIAIPQNNIFADENAKTTASVIINIVPGYEGDKEKIRAIIQLVAASVPELDPTNVAITDQYGHFLSSIISQNSILNQEQLTYQNNIQHYYENRIKMLITPIIGENKTSINVNTNIDFTQQEEAKEEYDPDQKSLRSEQSITESSATPGASGVPGALSNQPPEGATPAAGSGGDSAAAPAAGGQSRNESTKNYEVTKATRYVHNTAPVIKSISVAIVLDDESLYDESTKKTTQQPLSKDKIAKITELVKSTIGFNESRGDQVTVINSGFIQNKIENIPATPLWQQPWFWDWVKRISGIGGGFIFLIVLYKKIAPELKPSQLKPNAMSLSLTNDVFPVTQEMIQLKNEQISILKELASKDPNKVASIIKKWVTK